MSDDAHAPMIPISKPSLGEEEAAAGREAILSGWVTQGPQVAAFEEEFAAYVGAPHRLRGLELHDGAAPGPARPGRGPGRRGHHGQPFVHRHGQRGALLRGHAGLRGHRPADLQHGPRPDRSGDHSADRAIMPVHQMGLPCDLAAILAIAERHGLPVVEDAACAIGSEIRIGGRWERIGRPHGTVACFSFHPRKVITTGDGGMFTTRDPELDRKFRLLRQHGMSVPDTVRHAAKRSSSRNTRSSASTTG